MFSPDGTTFVLQQATDAGGNPLAPFVFDGNITQTDGTSFVAGRRERPWLLFGANGEPTALVTSMQAGVWHTTFTHAQAVGTT